MVTLSTANFDTQEC